MAAPREFFNRITAAAQKLAARFSRQGPEPPRRWPNLAPPEPIPADPADHAEDFAHRWVDRLENATEGRMHALHIPEEQIGSSDHLRSVAWRVFFPHERDGGGNGTGGRLNVDCGVLNPNTVEIGASHSLLLPWVCSGPKLQGGYDSHATRTVHAAAR